MARDLNLEMKEALLDSFIREVRGDNKLFKEQMITAGELEKMILQDAKHLYQLYDFYFKEEEEE